MIGSIFIHVRKDFAAYHFFASSLVGQRQQLSSLQAFGTDGELALENALMATFPNPQHVRCFLHFKGNIEQKLRELNVPSSVAAEIVKDIMGNPSQLQRGLVDAESTEKLEECLISFSKRWNKFEKPYNSPPFFHAWFLKHCQEVVAKFMPPSIRTKGGLGFPPTPYYTLIYESSG